MAMNFDINVSFNAGELKVLNQIFRKKYKSCCNHSEMIRNFTMDLISDKIDEWKIYNIFLRHRRMGKNFMQTIKLLEERAYSVSQFLPELERLEAKLKQAEEAKKLMEEATKKASTKNNANTNNSKIKSN